MTNKGLGLLLTLGVLVTGLGLTSVNNNVKAQLTLDEYIEQLPSAQQSPYDNPSQASHIQEIDIPVYNQPPSNDYNINTPDRVNTTNIIAIDFQSNETFGLPFFIDAQYQIDTAQLDVKRYFDCTVDKSFPLYNAAGQSENFKNTSKAQYIDILEGCIAVQCYEGEETAKLMEMSPMERALKQKSESLS